MSTARPFTITGWHVLAAVVAFFGVVVAVDSAFLIAAYRSHPGQVSVTPYEDGLAFNREVARRRAQVALGWTAAVAPSAGGLVVELRDSVGAPVSGQQLSGLLRRPATEAGEFRLTFSEASPGHYLARVRPAPGAWDVTVRSDKGAFEAERRLTWP